MSTAEDRLDRVFRALADPTRRAILGRLRGGPANVSEIAEPFAMSLPAISKHLRVLERAELIVRDIDGRRHRLQLAPDGLDDASTWLAAHRAFWEDRLADLAAHLEGE